MKIISKQFHDWLENGKALLVNIHLKEEQ